MIYTLTLNPCLDYYIQTCDDLNIGKTNRAENAQLKAGGKGVNVSLALQKFAQSNVQTLLALGGKNGERIMRELCDKNLECKAFNADGESRINVKINSNDTETEINSKGPAILQADKDEILRFFSQLESDDTIILAGSLPDKCEQDFYAKILSAAKCKNTAVDCTKGALKCALKSGVWLVKPNIDELCEFFEKQILWEDIPIFAKQLCAIGAHYALVSAGSKGAVLACKNTAYIAQAPKGKVVNCTGAGDTMLAAFVHWHEIFNGDAQNALRFAVAAGSAKAFSGDFPTSDEVEALAEKIAVTEVF